MKTITEYLVNNHLHKSETVAINIDNIKAGDYICVEYKNTKLYGKLSNKYSGGDTETFSFKYLITFNGNVNYVDSWGKHFLKYDNKYFCRTLNNVEKEICNEIEDYIKTNNINKPGQIGVMKNNKFVPIY